MLMATLTESRTHSSGSYTRQCEAVILTGMTQYKGTSAMAVGHLLYCDDL